MCHLKKSLCLADFEVMAEMEARYYGSEAISPSSIMWDMYQAYPYTTFAWETAGELVAFINLFPVKAPVYEDFIKGKISDSEIDLEDVFDISDSPQKQPVPMIFSCILILEDYRKTDLQAKILRHAVDFYQASGHDYCEIAMETVTPAGRRFADKLGFQEIRPTDRGTQLYQMAYADFVSQLDA